MALAAAATNATIGDREMVEVYTSLKSNDDPIPVLIRSSAASPIAKALLLFKPDDLVVVTGSLSLDKEGNTPELYVHTCCPAYPDQYLNNVSLTGRIGNESRVSESSKSCSRSVAVNRYSNGEQLTDWFKIRGYGNWRDRLQNAEKGSLTEVEGQLESRTNRNGEPYCEVKVRHVVVHSRSKSSAGNPAAGTNAVGYDHDAFSGIDTAPFDWND